MQLAHTKPVENIIKNRFVSCILIQAYALVTFISGLASLFAMVIWIDSGRNSLKICSYWMYKRKKIHYPLLVASAYSDM